MKQILILLFILSSMNLTSYSQHLITIKNQSFRKAFINGKIYTLSESWPYAESVIIEGNKIIYYGSDSSALEFITSDTEVIDLKGNLMLPGFNAGHLHINAGGYYKFGINLN